LAVFGTDKKKEAKVRRLSARKLRLNVIIKVYKNGQMIDSARKYKKSQIFQFVECIPFKERDIKAFLKVDYGIGTNASYHFSKRV
jgi:hypothetical protein